VTKVVRLMLQQRVAFLKEQWASGHFTDQSQFGTAIQNAKAIGNCEMCDEILTLDFQQLEGVMSDE